MEHKTLVRQLVTRKLQANEKRKAFCVCMADPKRAFCFAQRAVCFGTPATRPTK
jgi:hypothetical protein